MTVIRTGNPGPAQAAGASIPTVPVRINIEALEFFGKGLPDRAAA
jgi:hypothetical protein